MALLPVLRLADTALPAGMPVIATAATATVRRPGVTTTRTEGVATGLPRVVALLKTIPRRVAMTIRIAPLASTLLIRT